MLRENPSNIASRVSDILITEKFEIKQQVTFQIDRVNKFQNRINIAKVKAV